MNKHMMILFLPIPLMMAIIMLVLRLHHMDFGLLFFLSVIVFILQIGVPIIVITYFKDNFNDFVLWLKIAFIITIGISLAPVLLLLFIFVVTLIRSV
ncbi:MAG: hypothetical protein CVV21_03630 [Candidatus Goldiibacteriota bacterium HGW-Goldbacteria-1]|jgi:hypothetical protein|nr:MAG: hypothetical protein CVV21_03630 [Candidatus Goldiibacteriota bacterium HGW-Goldbacteria-1]